MTTHKNRLLSVVVPLYNERAGIERFHASLVTVLDTLEGYNYEIIYCNDGSVDGTNSIIHDITKTNPHVRFISLSRNFGKEIAVTAGIHEARGAAILTLDADGQHPVELLPAFVSKWEAGYKVVVGLRTSNQNEGLVKRYGSKLFYGVFNRVTGMKLIPRVTDFCLIDQVVQQEFSRMTEHSRITRGLIDWLGYDRYYIEFKANPRLDGEARYSFKKLFKLAIDSMVSLSISPLHVTAYIGAFVLPISALLGLGMVGNALFGDPLELHATGGAYVIVLILFLVGLLLMSQGIIGLYLSHIHTETQNRPLYIVNEGDSVGLHDS